MGERKRMRIRKEGRGGNEGNTKKGLEKGKELKERVVGKVLVHWWGK